MTSKNSTAINSESTAQLRVNEKKWSKVLMDAGWTAIPSVIIERQQALGLEPLDVNILLHLATYWWTHDNKPHPAKRTIADAIGVAPRTIQRRIAKMETDGLIKREERRVKGKGSRTNLYHFDGLIKEAQPYATEKMLEKEKADAERKKTAARKGRAKLELVKSADDEA
jgi:predicted transcriptional regulator